MKAVCWLESSLCTALLCVEMPENHYCNPSCCQEMFAYISDISKWISWCFEASSPKQQKINREKTPFGHRWFNAELRLQSSDLQTDVATLDRLTVQKPQNERSIMSDYDWERQRRCQWLQIIWFLSLKAVVKLWHVNDRSERGVVYGQSDLHSAGQLVNHREKSSISFI